MKRSIIRSLFASSVALFTLLVTAAAAFGGRLLPDPDPVCPPAPAPGTCQPGGIAAGPDGNVWFTEENGNRIGRITTGGAIHGVHRRPVGRRGARRDRGGPSGTQRLWFTESGTQQDRRASRPPARSPSTGPTDAPPDGIIAGPDGALWFTESTPLPGPAGSAGSPPPARSPTSTRSRVGSGPGDITVGPDGRLWFTEGGERPDHSQDRRNPDHRLRDQSFRPTDGSDPSGITPRPAAPCGSRRRRPTRSAASRLMA